MGRDRSSQPMVAALAEIAHLILRSIGPEGRHLLRETAELLRDLPDDEARQVLLDEAAALRMRLEAALADPDILAYGDMEATNAAALLQLREEDPAQFVDWLVEAHQQPGAIEEIEQALDGVSVSPEQQERIEAGLKAWRNPGATWAVPCDLLLGSVEGLLWERAEREGVVRPGEAHLLRHPRQLAAKSVNRILDNRHGLALELAVRKFLGERVFAGSGQSLRHRRAGGDARAGAALALVALRALLTADERLIQLLASRLDRVADRRRIRPPEAMRLRSGP